MHEIQDVLQKNEFHAFTCAETWLQNGDLTTMYEISGYDLRRNDRISGKKGGGCCIYIRQDCSVSELKIGVAFPSNTEVYVYKFNALYTRPIIYVSVYNTPNVCKNEFLLALDCLLTHLHRYDLKLL